MNGKVMIETERCVIRELTMDDMDDLFRLYEPPEISRFVEPLESYEEEVEYNRNYIEIIYRGYGYGIWLVIEKSSGEVIGRAGLEPHLEDPEDTVELGCLIAADKQRQGFAREVCGAIIDYAWDALHKDIVYVRIHPDNEASNLLFGGLGFAPTDDWVKGERVWKLWR